MRQSEIITVTRCAGLALALAAIVAAGCGGGGYTTLYSAPPRPHTSPSVAPSPSPSQSPSPSPSPTTAIVGVKLSGESPDNDPTYGTLLGYFNSTGAPNNQSSVVNLTMATQVMFHDFDPVNPHTGSFLGDASQNGASFPPTFTGSLNQSPAGTIISTTNFSTGNLNPNGVSLVYNSGPPGFYMFGCAYHYVSNGMRTIVIVQ